MKLKLYKMNGRYKLDVYENEDDKNPILCCDIEGAAEDAIKRAKMTNEEFNKKNTK